MENNKEENKEDVLPSRQFVEELIYENIRLMEQNIRLMLKNRKLRAELREIKVLERWWRFDGQKMAEDSS
jgi:hypothetical protein